MDRRAAQIFRDAKANPGDERAQERWKRQAQRMWDNPASRFQRDLASQTGRIWRALAWEMEFSRSSVRCLEAGGQVIAMPTFGHGRTFVRVWYPLLADVQADGLTEDVRITVASPPHLLSDVLESLSDNFPGATVVSSGVAAAQQDGWKAWQDMSKPLKRREIDKGALAVGVPVGVSRGRVAGASTWVA